MIMGSDKTVDTRTFQRIPVTSTLGLGQGMPSIRMRTSASQAEGKTRLLESGRGGGSHKELTKEEERKGSNGRK